jgi:glycine cleavage system H protein
MNVYYTTDHEWIAFDGDIATVGITHHAQSLLGDLVFVQLPPVGEKVDKGGEVALVESVKAASDVLAPLSGSIVEVNASVLENPAVINSDPMGAGWLFKLKVGQPIDIDSLLSQSAYEATLR